MPTEIRHVMFRPPEVAYAVQLFFQRMGQSLPPGTIESCVPEGDGKTGPLSVRITVTPPSSAMGPASVVVDEITLTAVLLLYCKGKKIPMPARASKSLLRFGDQVCLVSTLNPKQEELLPDPSGPV